MTTHLSLSPLFSSTIGFDRFSDLFERLERGLDADGYPPYDVEKTGDDAYRITLAVAGFSESELQISAKEDQLVITGRKQKTDDDDKVHYLHKGIAARGFEQTFRLADYVVVKGAELRDGLLSIDLVRELPDDLKPRRIEIKSGAGLNAISSAERQKRLS